MNLGDGQRPLHEWREVVVVRAFEYY
jgi:hypothetical protein